MASETHELHRLAAYLRTAFPDTPGATPVDQALWLLEHLRRLEQIQPSPIFTWYTLQHQETHTRSIRNVPG